MAVALTYEATYASVPTSDGYQWIALIEGAGARERVPAYHALPMVLLAFLRDGLAAEGVSAGALAVIQAVNAALAGAAAVLLCATIEVLGGGILLGLAGGGLLAASFGSWYFANGELHHFSLVVIELIFYLLVRARALGSAPSIRAIAGLGTLNAVAVLLHQESFLFGAAAVALLAVGRPLLQGARDALVYAVSGSVATAVLALAVGVGLRGARGVDEWLRWFFWAVYSAGEPAPYAVGGPLGAALRAAKGQLTALTIGAQVVADAARDLALLRVPRVAVLLVLTALAAAIGVALLAALWHRRTTLGTPLRVAAAGALAWLAAYKLLLQWWFWPTAPEYHIATLPPLILLLLLGPIAARRSWSARLATTPPSVSVAPPRWAVAAPLALVALVAAIDAAGAIAPWHAYGRVTQALADRARAAWRPDDLFVSSESGIDAVLAPVGQHIALKNLFARSPRDGAMATLRAAIAGQLAAGRRVFVYNLVPSPYTLTGLAQAAAARGAPAPTAEDFGMFDRELRRRYAFVPVMPYWEEGRTPLYLLGQREEWIWEVRPLDG